MTSINTDNDPLILDFGSGVSKAGFAGEDCPRFVYQSSLLENDNHVLVAGNEIMNDKYNLRHVSSLYNPIQRGVIKNWEHFEILFEEMLNYYKIEVKAEYSPMLISDVILNGKENRTQLVKLLFEKFKVPKLYFAYQNVLSLFSTGRTTGLCLEIGHGITQSVPIFEGYALQHASLKFDFGGEDLTEYLKSLLTVRLQNKLTTIGSLKIVNGIKEKLCTLIPMENEREYVLPDKKIIKVGDEMNKCPESLFHPQVMHKNVPGIDEILYSSFIKCDDYLKKLLHNNVVLSGGSTMFGGIKNRLSCELSEKKKISFNIDDSAERKFSVWIGKYISSFKMSKFL